MNTRQIYEYIRRTGPVGSAIADHRTKQGGHFPFPIMGPRVPAPTTVCHGSVSRANCTQEKTLCLSDHSAVASRIISPGSLPDFLKKEKRNSRKDAATQSISHRLFLRSRISLPEPIFPKFLFLFLIFLCVSASLREKLFLFQFRNA